MTLTRFAKYAWGVLAYNVAVILWGTFVRATGSGAGCGEHWPLCNGAVVPHSPQVHTLIEFSHRLSSGLALALVVGLVAWAFRVYPRGSLVRRGSAWSLGFILVEAAIGAFIVLLRLVAHNASVERAISSSLHLGNTLLLLAALTLTAWWASGGAPLQLRGRGWGPWAFGLGLIGVIVISASGAVVALGDTLFPAASLAQGLAQDVDPAAHFLLRLRVYHPVIAITVGLYLLWLAFYVTSTTPNATARRFAWLTAGLVVAQWTAGFVNVILLAPAWMQLVHLLLADAIWVSLVLWAASALALTETRPALPGVTAGRGAAAD
jgi:heme A synthase